MSDEFAPDMDRVMFTGPGWQRLAAAVAEEVSPDDIEAIYAFQPIKRFGREWGTVVVTRVAGPGDRRRVYHGRFWFQWQGNERGRGKAEIREVGVGPPNAVAEMIAGVQRRAGDPDPPVQIDPRWWFGRDRDGPADEPSQDAAAGASGPT